jgi:cell wall-associated NlpC family hydrolase
MSVLKKIATTVALTAGLSLALAGPAHAYPTERGVTTGVETGISVVTAPEDEASAEGVQDEEVAPFAAAKVGYGKTIKRADVIKRAKNWYNRNVPYSQSAYAWDINKGKKYRTDCSGFVSMTWALTSSRTTRNLHEVSTKIAWKNLKPGDMVLRKGHHVQLFEKWTSSAHTSFWIYEEGSTASDMNHRKVKVSSEKSSGYVPYKYKKIK